MAGVLIVACLIMVGCGDDDDSTASGGSASSAAGTQSSPTDAAGAKVIAKAPFLKQGNAICDETVKRVASVTWPAIQESFEEESEESQVKVEAELAETVMAPELRREAEQIQALGVPAGDEAQVAAILAAILNVANEAEGNAEAVIGNSRVFDEPSRLAGSYGLGSCPYG